MGKNYTSRESVLVITVGWLLVYVLLKVKFALYCALVIGLAGASSLYLSEKIDWCWNKISTALGTINNYILLTLVFFLVVTPVGLIRRTLKKNNLAEPGKKTTSGFIERDHLYTPEDLENTW